MNAKLGTIVAAGLAGVLLLCVVSIAVLAGLDKSSPGVLENLAAGALGALAALLARVGSEVQPVQVVNRGPDEAVPVDEGAVSVVEALLIVFLIVVTLVVIGVL